MFTFWTVADGWPCRLTDATARRPPDDETAEAIDLELREGT